jgi:hypothetical protein
MKSQWNAFCKIKDQNENSKIMASAFSQGFLHWIPAFAGMTQGGIGFIPLGVVGTGR